MEGRLVGLAFFAIVVLVSTKLKSNKPKKRSYTKRQSTPEEEFYKYVKRLPEKP